MVVPAATAVPTSYYQVCTAVLAFMLFIALSTILFIVASPLQDLNSTQVTQHPALPISAPGVVTVSLLAAIAVGACAFCITRESTPTRGSGTFFFVELCDLGTDVAGFYLTSKEGDLAFSNDPLGIVRYALLVSVFFGGGLFAAEVGYCYLPWSVLGFHF